VTSGIRVVKGHGTQNDFVLLPDPDARLTLTAELVSALCDRRAGLGGDGVIRVARSAAVPDGVEQSGQAEWFMDYRNADGSVAEMCGNGIRVMVAFLLREGLVSLADGEVLPVGSRAGVRRVRRDGDLLAVDLGRWRVSGETSGAGGHDVTVRLAGEAVALPGLGVDVGNPHVVVAVPDAGRLADLDLTVPPVIEPEPPHGANVEIVVPESAADGVGRLAMRVHERGVGETRSCGTGAAAAALATRAWAGAGAPDVWAVQVLGGLLRVSVPGAPLHGADAVELAGPATLVADGTLEPGWADAVAGVTDRPRAT
jgi:diaminopimelate epimerase